ARTRGGGRHRGADVRDRQSSLDGLAGPGDAGGRDREGTKGSEDFNALVKGRLNGGDKRNPQCGGPPRNASQPEANRCFPGKLRDRRERSAGSPGQTGHAEASRQGRAATGKSSQHHPSHGAASSEGAASTQLSVVTSWERASNLTAGRSGLLG